MKQIDEQLVQKVVVAMSPVVRELIAQLPDGPREYAERFERDALADLAAQLGIDDLAGKAPGLMREIVLAAVSCAGEVKKLAARPDVGAIGQQVESALLQRGVDFLTANWKTILASSGSGAAVLEMLKKLGVM